MHRANLSQRKVILLQNVPRVSTNENVQLVCSRNSRRNSRLSIIQSTRTETKRKTRTVHAGGYAEVKLEDFQERKKPKQLTKEQKIVELYGEELLAVKIVRGMIAMYKAGPRKVAVEQCSVGNTGNCNWEKVKAARGVAKKVDEATVEKFVDFCLRPDSLQDVAFGDTDTK